MQTRFFRAQVLLCLLLLPLLAHAQSGLSQWLGIGGNDDPLPVTEAFPLSVERIAPDAVTVQWDTRKAYYLYKDKIRFELPGGEAEIADSRLPSGEIKDDPYFGPMEVLYGPVQAHVQFDRPIDDELLLRVHYQGCADAGLCYPPEQTDFQLAAFTGSSTSGNAVGSTVATPPAPQDEGMRLSTLLAEGSLPLILGAFFAAGLLLAFTACLYPMIPILSGLIAGDRHRKSGLRAFLLSLTYVEATAITYALAGVAAGLSGVAIQADLQNPWVLGSFAALFVLLALGMFGVYELQMPSAWQSRIDALSRNQRGGTFIGVAIMGVLSTLIVGACSGPALIAALAFISSTGDAWLGGLALFTLANGMGLPLLLIGTAAGKWLPRSGPWMTAVRQVFGVLFLAVALWMVERLIPSHIALALWGVLLLGCAVFLGALDHLTSESDALPRLRKAGGLVLLIWGALLLLGAAAGSNNFWQPLTALRVSDGAAVANNAAPRFEPVASLPELERALTAARQAGQPVVVDVYADWCVYCVQLERETFPDPAVQQSLAQARLLRIDVTAMNESDKALLQSLDVFLPPAVIFYGADGTERRQYRVAGFLPPDEFASRARRALAQGTSI